VKQGSIHLQLITGLKTAARVATSPRFALAVVFVPLLLYLFREITHDALIIDPFIVPARFTDAGLTGQVIAQRVGDHLRHIEVLSRTRMPTDHPLGSQDETVIPDIEIPGTNLGLKTLVAVVRGIFSVYPTRVTGDIVFPVALDPKDLSIGSNIGVTIYITRGREHYAALRLTAAATDLDQLADEAAKLIVKAINPYVYASYLDRHGNTLDASTIVDSILLNPNSTPAQLKAAYNLLGNIRLKQSRLDEAIALFSKAVAIDDHFAMAYNNWGISLERQHKHDEALKMYQKAIRVDRHFAAGYDNWGGLLVKQKDYPGAIAMYEKALTRDRLDVNAYERWGAALDAQHSYDAAAEKYKTALSIDPTDATAYILWGTLLAEQNKLDDADARYQSAIAIDPSNVETYRNVADALRVQKRYDQAVVMYTQAIGINTRSLAAYNNCGLAMLEQGKYDDAIAMFKKAIAVEPTYANAYNNWGEALSRQGPDKLQEAIRMYKKAIGLNDRFAEAYDGLGHVLVTLGDKAEGEAMLAKSRALASN
jgi:tetratricopeptide (TPR) repeat protein